MTAIEWLENELNTKGKLTPVDFYQAKEMEKQQIKYAFSEGWVHGNICVDKPSKEYYNETYKKDNP